MAKRNSEARMERFNIMLSFEESEWLNQFAADIKARSGANVTRSEIIRAGLTTLRELQHAAPLCPSRFIALEACTDAGQLAQMGVLAVRWATPSER